MPGSPIELMVGLGNPGPEYENTRHNAGFWVLDRIAQQHGTVFRLDRKVHGFVARMTSAGTAPCWLLKPQTYVNHSGQAVGALASYYRIPLERILVIHDELDLPAGALRLKSGGGHGGHNGLKDILAVLGGEGFLRARVGIGRPPPGGDVVTYVLNAPAQTDRILIDDAVARLGEALTTILAGDAQRVMNQLNRAA
ncbi:MAG: aminoacyl-tRNA hydrolase [Pseudomonadota bacterium]